jgi:SAM-dependent methyltransferase
MYRVRGEVFDAIVGSLEAESADRARPWRVLDIGAGTGFYVERWLARGATATGCDLTAIAVERLRERFPDSQFIQADIGQPPGPELARLEGSFDAVSAFDVLFHIVDDTAYHRAIANAARLLRPGGYFLWSDNFLRGPTIRVAHQVSRTLGDASAAVAAAGLEIVRRQPMFVLMNYPADTRSRLGRLAWTAMVSPAVLSDRLGGLLGRALYPIERRLVRRLSESPSTEIMVCRRSGSA